MSKVSKRTVPANEALSRILQMDTIKSIVRVIERRPELVGKELTILLAGDSTSTACLFAPHLAIKSMLLRNVIRTVRQHCKDILEMLPRANIQLLWIESEENSADKASKLFFDPINQTYMRVYREGPDCLRDNKAKKHTFLKITKESEIYTSLPE